MCKNSLACIISLINVYNHLHSEVSQICFEGGVAKTLYIPYKLILIGGVANQNNFATPPKYLRHLLTMQLKSRVKTNLRHFPTICQLYSPHFLSLFLSCSHVHVTLATIIYRSMYLLPTCYLPVTPTAIILHIFAKFFVVCIARPFGFLELISFSDFLTASCVLTSQSGCG